MHELSIALGILDIVEEQSHRLERAPTAVHVRIGALSGVVKESLLAAFDVARRHSPFGTMELIVEESPVTAWCEKCNGERPIMSLQNFSCEDCRGPVSRIVSGQELLVTGLEVTS